MDADYQSKLQADGIDLAKYRAVVQGDVIRQKLEEKIVADATQPAPQRRVAEIYIHDSGDAENAPPSRPAPSRSATSCTRRRTTPRARPTCRTRIRRGPPPRPRRTPTYAKLLADPVPVRLDRPRRTATRPSATGPTGTGGKLPYYDKTSQIDDGVQGRDPRRTALKPGDILAPVKSAFGWHVIQIMYGPTDSDELNALKVKADAGADFGALARDYSDAPDASTGGDIGWLAKGQFDDARHGRDLRRRPSARRALS